MIPLACLGNQRRQDSGLVFELEHGQIASDLHFRLP